MKDLEKVYWGFKSIDDCKKTQKTFSGRFAIFYEEDNHLTYINCDVEEWSKELEKIDGYERIDETTLTFNGFNVYLSVIVRLL